MQQSSLYLRHIERHSRNLIDGEQPTNVTDTRAGRVPSGPEGGAGGHRHAGVKGHPGHTLVVPAAAITFAGGDGLSITQVHQLEA